MEIRVPVNTSSGHLATVNSSHCIFSSVTYSLKVLLYPSQFGWNLVGQFRCPTFLALMRSVRGSYVAPIKSPTWLSYSFQHKFLLCPPQCGLNCNGNLARLCRWIGFPVQKSSAGRISSCTWHHSKYQAIFPFDYAHRRPSSFSLATMHTAEDSIISGSDSVRA